MSPPVALPDLLEPGRWPVLAAALGPWALQQRWFGGKARSVDGVEVVDAFLLGDAAVLVAVLEVRYAGGTTERYQVPLAASGADGPVRVEGLALCDAAEDPEGRRALAEASLTEWSSPTAQGAVVEGDPVAGAPQAALDRSRKLGVEQSNTSIVYDDTLILKVFRRLEPGLNPDVELTRALTEAGFRNTPAQAGSLRLTHGTGEPTYLTVVSSFAGDAREGWAVAVEEAARVFDGAGGGTLVDEMDALGRVVARMHVVLRDSLGAEEASFDDADGWTRSMQSQAARVLELAERRAPELTAPVLALREDILARFAGLAELGDLGLLVRTHGDLHLGQVLADPAEGWLLLDFEGEPARPLAERRVRQTPLRDVAGVLRSFDYAAASAALDPPPDLAAWRDELRRAFLGGYRAVAEPDGLLPGSTWQPLLAAFELDKALYELGYELENRPSWVAIPVTGVLRIMTAHDANAPDDDQTTAKKATAKKAATKKAATKKAAAKQPTAKKAAAKKAATKKAAAKQPMAKKAAAKKAVRAPAAETAATGSPQQPTGKADREEVEGLLRGEHRDPHHLLGPHETADGAVVRAFRPDADQVEVVVDGRAVEATRIHDAGLFEAPLDALPAAASYRLRVTYAEDTFDLWDAYAFWPTFGEIDLHLMGEGRHEELWRRMGASVIDVEGVTGTAFAVWAPNAKGVRVIGEFNSWDGRLHPMRLLGSSGVWELFVPDVGNGTSYKYEIVTAEGALVERADPHANYAEVPPARASRVFTSSYEWSDDEWLARRADADHLREPMSIYEVHLGSWKQADGQALGYRDLAHQLADHCNSLGFTHVELLPVAEHPFGGSWGYQVTGYYAPTSRFGDPDDFRHFVDHLHSKGVGVIVDWVPAHFPRDEWALARFDGTALYEHLDPRQGEHPDWGTLVFNFGRNEVRNFLVANALYWIEELHVDGLRVDAVASMLYLDYSRKEGEWLPNEHGGRENLESVAFLQELNKIVYGRNPGALMIAEESTAWPGVTRPVHLGGLGFGFKWNMGWMHDTLSYVQRDAIYRRYHHHEMSFGLMYAWSEHFVLPFSHDEVVHGKRSMLDKMPGDRWQKFANLRALYGWMWAHPGKQLLFMGQEFGQWREWSEQRSLDWHLLQESDHEGLLRLIGDLNRTYKGEAALWRRDPEPESFQWIDANNADANFLAFARHGGDDDGSLVCLTNFSPVAREGIRVGLPHGGPWREVLNTDAEVYGGGNVGNLGVVNAEDLAWHGLPASAEVVVPPLATVWLAPGTP
jgi:1,4-alpha-glucan branching enzyme